MVFEIPFKHRAVHPADEFPIPSTLDSDLHHEKLRNEDDQTKGKSKRPELENSDHLVYRQFTGASFGIRHFKLLVGVLPDKIVCKSTGLKVHYALVDLVNQVEPLAKINHQVVRHQRLFADLVSEAVVVHLVAVECSGHVLENDALELGIESLSTVAIDSVQRDYYSSVNVENKGSCLSIQ